MLICTSWFCEHVREQFKFDRSYINIIMFLSITGFFALWSIFSVCSPHELINSQVAFSCLCDLCFFFLCTFLCMCFIPISCIVHVKAPLFQLLMLSCVLHMMIFVVTVLFIWTLKIHHNPIGKLYNKNMSHEVYKHVNKLVLFYFFNCV